MGLERRSFTEGFKAVVIEWLNQTGATQGDVAKELGITSTQMKTWRFEI